ncbi:MAG: arylsulfatase [Opitutia bacterium]|jgi:arylsulfatase A-like enzyme
MTLVRFILLVLAAACAAEPVRPNVLLILADDLGYSDLGCYGGEIPTPNLDRIAARGARFEKCYTSARCCPTRASLLTGRHPHEAGVGDFVTAKPAARLGPAYTGHLLEDNATLAETLGAAGYSTYMVGKWHLGRPGPIERGFAHYFGFRKMDSHSEDQWDPSLYARLPEGVKPELPAEAGRFYATDVFTDYALEFMRQARTKGAPWFVYLAHSSPHFPIQAPKESVERHLATYRRGWDVLREERFARMKRLGLLPPDMALPPRSEVPVDRDDIANGFSGRANPAWESLPAERREDLARRMAVFAAMVEHVDRGVGRILSDLERAGELERTIIVFTSDNGACYEWGPFGFDGVSRRGRNDLHRGEELARMGQAGTHSSYGSGWAMLGNTPLAMYKHFCHEGGVSVPLVVSWPAGFAAREGWVRSPAHVMDLLPTLAEACGAPLLRERAGVKVPPPSGVSLLPAMKGRELPPRPIPTAHQGARGLRLGDWKAVWGKRQNDPVRWELYDLSKDPGETVDLADRHPAKLRELTDAWDDWAGRVGVDVKAR